MVFSLLKKTLNISVIQGSTGIPVLSPVLFFVDINYLYSASSLLKFMFADDTACIASDNNLDNLMNSVNNKLKKVARWFRFKKRLVM
jgi:hypothetical protein